MMRARLANELVLSAVGEVIWGKLRLFRFVIYVKSSVRRACCGVW